MIMYHFSYKNFNFLDKLSENTEFAYKFAAGREGAKTKKRIELWWVLLPSVFRLTALSHFCIKKFFLKS